MTHCVGVVDLLPLHLHLGPRYGSGTVLAQTSPMSATKMYYASTLVLISDAVPPDYKAASTRVLHYVQTKAIHT